MKFLKPQLARPWTERRDANLIDMNGFTMEPKLDGHRVAVIRHNKGVSLVSRQGKPVQQIPWLITWAQRQLKPGTYIDGELVVPATEGSSNNVSSYRAHHPARLCYVAFDILWHRGRTVHSMQWYKRRRELESISEMAFPWPKGGNLRPSKFYIICTYPREFEHINHRTNRAQAWIDQGFEGVMYKDMFIPYKPNSRSGWIKEKTTQLVKAIVVSCDALPSEWRVRPGHKGTDGKVYPEGRHTDPWLAGHVGLEYGYGPWTGPATSRPGFKEVPGVGKCEVAGSLGVTGPREEMAQYVGQVVTMKCWGVYPSGAVRHPSPQRYVDYDGDFYDQPDPTVEVET